MEWEPGVWYGQLSLNVPMIMMSMCARTPNEVAPRTTDATVVSIVQRYWESAHPRSRRENWSMMGRDSITCSKYQVTIPLSFRCRCWLLSIADPRTSMDTYRFNHCLPSMARNAENSDAARLEKRMLWTCTIVRGGPVHCGTVGTDPPNVVLSSLWMRTRRRAAVSSFGSDCSCWLKSTMKADVTAENKPACAPRQRKSHRPNKELTNIRVVFRSSSCFFINTLSYSSATL
jgi:hypothetical protein